MVLQQGLQLHLKLDELIQKGDQLVVSDFSGNKYNGNVHGDAIIVPDDRFGSSLLFDGVNDWVEMPQKLQLKDTFTVSAWVLSNAGNQKDQCFIGKHDNAGGNQFLLGFWKKKLSVNLKNKAYYFSKNLPKANTWFHIVVTIEKISDKQSKITIFIDGKLWDQQTADVVVSDTTGKPWVLGQDWDKNKNTDFLKGNMTDVKFFNRLISQEEIEAEILDAQSSSAVFKSTYPLDFTLTDHDVKNVLYIANAHDGIPEQADLSITNTSTKTLVIKPLTDDNAPQYHLELRFRPSTFEDTVIENEKKEKWQYLNIISAPNNWKASAATLHPVNNTVSVFFTY